MNIQEIRKLLEMFDHSESVKLKITNDNFEITLEKDSNKQSKQQYVETIAAPIINQEIAATRTEEVINTPKNTPANTETITSPMVGTFYRAPSADSAPYVNVGDKVKKGQTIAIIEAMKIMNEIEAEFDCKIIEILVSDAQSVEYNAPLFLVEKI